jgi:hypothetical protein
MDLTQEAIEYLELCEAGDKFLYREVAKMFGVSSLSIKPQSSSRSQLVSPNNPS